MLSENLWDSKGIPLLKTGTGPLAKSPSDSENNLDMSADWLFLQKVNTEGNSNCTTNRNWKKKKSKKIARN